MRFFFFGFLIFPEQFFFSCCDLFIWIFVCLFLCLLLFLLLFMMWRRKNNWSRTTKSHYKHVNNDIYSMCVCVFRLPFTFLPISWRTIFASVVVVVVVSYIIFCFFMVLILFSFILRQNESDVYCFNAFTKRKQLLCMCINIFLSPIFQSPINFVSMKWWCQRTLTIWITMCLKNVW